MPTDYNSPENVLRRQVDQQWKDAIAKYVPQVSLIACAGADHVIGWLFRYLRDNGHPFQLTFPREWNVTGVSQEPPTVVRIVVKSDVPMEEWHSLDRQQNPCGTYYIAVPRTGKMSIERALDVFHSVTPIKQLDDFDIDAEIVATCAGPFPSREWHERAIGKEPEDCEAGPSGANVIYGDDPGA